MSPHLYRLLMNAKLTDLRQRYHDRRSSRQATDPGSEQAMGMMSMAVTLQDTQNGSVAA